MGRTRPSRDLRCIALVEDIRRFSFVRVVTDVSVRHALVFKPHFEFAVFLCGVGRQQMLDRNVRAR